MMLQHATLHSKGVQTGPTVFFLIGLVSDILPFRMLSSLHFM
jgi:hypothetical protein